MTQKQMIFYGGLVLCFVVSMLFVQNNHSLYECSIARVLEINLVDTEETIDMFGNKDKIFTQRITAEVKNGVEEGKLIYLTNEFSLSGGFDQEYSVGDDLFVLISESSEEDTALSGTIKDVKRDTYVVLVAWLFIFILLIVGKKQGLYSIISLVVNAAILSFALNVYLNTSDISLVLISGVGIILFTVISLLLVNGYNEKTFAAIIATLLATFASILITYLAMQITNEQGLRYEEMQFITRPYRMIFMAGVMIGSLGAVMDVAITMSSSIFALFEKNNNIPIKVLRQSGMDIGKDIMGTMTNILFFAYISGAIPTLILYFMNGSPIGYTLSMNLSLELARAMAGGIGIVLTIPIGLYTAIFFVNRKKAEI